MNFYVIDIIYYTYIIQVNSEGEVTHIRRRPEPNSVVYDHCRYLSFLVGLCISRSTGLPDELDGCGRHGANIYDGWMMVW